jgi:hypothetical protein
MIRANPDWDRPDPPGPGPADRPATGRSDRPSVVRVNPQWNRAALLPQNSRVAWPEPAFRSGRAPSSAPGGRFLAPHGTSWQPFGRRTQAGRIRPCLGMAGSNRAAPEGAGGPAWHSDGGRKQPAGDLVPAEAVPVPEARPTVGAHPMTSHALHGLHGLHEQRARVTHAKHGRWRLFPPCFACFARKTHQCCAQRMAAGAESERFGRLVDNVLQAAMLKGCPADGRRPPMRLMYPMCRSYDAPGATPKHGHQRGVRGHRATRR